MKILWITNIIFPDVGAKLKISYSNSGGWMDFFYKKINEDSSINLTICSFNADAEKTIKIPVGNVDFAILPKKRKHFHEYDSSIEHCLEELILEIKPDLVHIWGTEFSHSLSAVNVCKNLGIKHAISIQGLISVCALRYTCGINKSVLRKKTIRDVIRKDSISNQEKYMAIRGKMEIECIKKTKYIIGRTDWDYSNVKSFNKDISYYFCNECLRESFYNHSWNIDKIQRHSIFISQANYPIKGFHTFLEALKIIKRKYPDVKVFVAGGLKLFNLTMKEKLKQTYYERYLTDLIIKYNLKDNIVFLKTLNETEMVEQYLKTHVFVSSSSIENSPNSVGEAMILGVPIVSSFVGGVSNLINHKIDGLFYPFYETNLLAQYVMNIFEKDEVALEFSKNSSIHAKQIYNKKTNIEQLKNIYIDILSK